MLSFAEVFWHVRISGSKTVPQLRKTRLRNETPTPWTAVSPNPGKAPGLNAGPRRLLQKNRSLSRFASRRGVQKRGPLGVFPLQNCASILMAVA